MSGSCVKKPTTLLRRGLQTRPPGLTAPAEKIRGKESKPTRGQTVPPAITRLITRRAIARTRGIAQAEPGDAEGDQQHEDVLPFFADDACRARIIGDELRGNSLKPSDDFVACSAPTISATATPMMSVVINERFMSNQAFCADAAG